MFLHDKQLAVIAVQHTDVGDVVVDVLSLSTLSSTSWSSFYLLSFSSSYASNSSILFLNLSSSVSSFFNSSFAASSLALSAFYFSYSASFSFSSASSSLITASASLFSPIYFSPSNESGYEMTATVSGLIDLSMTWIKSSISFLNISSGFGSSSSHGA